MHHTILYNELTPLSIIPTFSTVAAYQTSQIIMGAVKKTYHNENYYLSEVYFCTKFITVSSAQVKC